MTKRKAAVFLWFDTKAEEAAEFYAATFPDTEIETITRVPEGVPGIPAGTVQVVEMTLLGLPYVLLNAGCQRRSKIRPLWRSKSRPVWGERLGACGPHIASPVQGALAVRPIL